MASLLGTVPDKHHKELMKLFIIALLISFQSLACNNLINKENADKAIASDPSAKAGCDSSKEKCYCYDTIDWESALFVDEIVNGAPIYTVNSQTLCESEEDCLAKMQSLVCDAGFVAKYRMDNPQAFCERLDGYEQVNTGEKVLVNNAAKKAAKEQRQALREQKRAERKAKRDAAKEELKNIDWAQITTIAKMRQVLKAVVDKLEEED